MASAFGQSPAAGNGDLGTALANAAITVGTAFGVAQAGKSTGKAVKQNSTTIWVVAGIGAVVIIGGMITLAVILKR